MAEMVVIGFFRSMTTVAVVIRGIGYGLVLASFAAFFITLANKKIVKAILGADALTRESAKTRDDLGINGPISRFTLRDRSALRKTVAATKINSGEAAETRYYIPEEKAAGAEIRYVKRNSPIAWIVGMALLAAATEGAVLVVPWILSLFS